VEIGEPAEQRLGFGGPLAGPGSQQPVPGPDQQLFTGALAEAARPTSPQLQLRPLRVVLRPQLEGLGVVAGRGDLGAERGGMVTGLTQDEASAVDQFAGWLVSSPRVGQRLGVVVGEQLRPIACSVRGKLLQPRRRPPVAVGARGSAQLGVGDITNQDVAEGDLDLPGHPGPSHPPQQLPSFQLAQPPVQVHPDV
jgi:hypothetical protein